MAWAEDLPPSAQPIDEELNRKELNRRLNATGAMIMQAKVVLKKNLAFEDQLAALMEREQLEYTQRMEHLRRQLERKRQQQSQHRPPKRKPSQHDLRGL